MRRSTARQAQRRGGRQVGSGDPNKRAVVEEFRLSGLSSHYVPRIGQSSGFDADRCRVIDAALARLRGEPNAAA